MINVPEIKNDFPIFKTYKDRFGFDLIFLDSAASSQTPEQVVAPMNRYYYEFRSNVHRSPYTLGTDATRAYEEARETVARFIGAEKWEIIFTPGATVGVNMLVYMLEKHLNISQSDDILTTVAEHHSNLLPFQELAKRSGASLRVISLHGTHIDYKNLNDKINSATKIVTLSLTSNILGTIFDIKPIIERAREVGAITIIDATTAAGHLPIDVTDIGCDFLFFSGHKMLGPTGIGVLFGREEILNELQPSFYGGGMISSVSEQTADYRDIPMRFEAGTPNIAGAIGLGKAIEYLEKIGLPTIQTHSQKLARYATEKLVCIPGLVLVSEPEEASNSGIVSFFIEGINSHALAEFLNERHIALRAGHHCALPLATSLGSRSICRASFYIYNEISDIDTLVQTVEDGKKILAVT